MKKDSLVDPVNQEELKYDAKVLRGKNGRLFLDNDSNDVIKQHTGELLLSNRQLNDWRFVLENRVAWLEKWGIPYFFLVPPNAHSVYPDELPDAIRIGQVRPVQQLTKHLEDSGSFSRIIYPLDDLLAAKPNPLLYAKGDSHWSAYGAFIAYRRLAEEIAPASPMHLVSEEDLSYQEGPWTGGLGFKLEPKEESIQVTATVKRPIACLVSDNRLFDKGMMVVTHCPDAPQSTCVVFGDSFAKRLHRFLAASFRRLVYVMMPTLDYELVRQEQPDVVLSVMNERFLVRVPYDAGAPTWQDWEKKYLALGLVREELSDWPRADGKR